MDRNEPIALRICDITNLDPLCDSNNETVLGKSNVWQNKVAWHFVAIFHNNLASLGLTSIYIIRKWKVMASWLVHWTPDRAVRVLALARALSPVLEQDTLLSLCLSSPRCINEYQRIYCWGNPAMD